MSWRLLPPRCNTESPSLKFPKHCGMNPLKPLLDKSRISRNFSSQMTEKMFPVLELLKFSKRERDLTTQLAICKAQLNELGETSDDRLNVVPNELRSASVTDPNAKEHCSNCMAEKSQFDRRKILSGSSPCNPQYPSWRDDKEEDKFIKELGTTKDKFTTPK
ncbi:hypothetical protein NC651_027134 [Populus alba x Populus x berolinensis]|nr:hypothetical protein NC651_027134 [Populus alba x Populus x berolinensis]